MSFKFEIECNDQALPRLLGFLLNQSGEPDDRYKWKSEDLYIDPYGITWGAFDYEVINSGKFFVAFYSAESFLSPEAADKCSALYRDSNEYEGSALAADIYSVTNTAATCLGYSGTLVTVFGLKGFLDA